jgi:hypothetical protein
LRDIALEISEPVSKIGSNDIMTAFCGHHHAHRDGDFHFLTFHVVKRSPMTSTLTLEIGRLLHQPFDPTFVRFRPQNPKPRNEARPDGPWYCLALAYYEVWDLVNIFDTYVYAQWSIEEQQMLFSEQDDRIVVSLVLVICGVRMAGIGEEFLDAETKTDENAVTSAWAQAFKRACALFGLGLGMYFLPHLSIRYVAYDRSAKKISASPDVLLALAQELYKRTPDVLLRGSVGVEGQDLASLKAAIIRPFKPQEIDFLPLPGSRRQEQDGSWICEANPYIEIWGLVRRLNAIAYGIWSVPRVEVMLARNMVITTVWLSIGEDTQPGVWQEPLTVADKSGQKSRRLNDAVTTAYSYAFKRACHLHSLALYLRFLHPPIVPMANNRIAKHSLDIAVALYRANGLPLTGRYDTASEETASHQPGHEISRSTETRARAILQHDPWRVPDICAHYEVTHLDDLSEGQFSHLDRQLQAMSRPGTATEEQVNKLRPLCAHFGEALPEQPTLSYNEALALLHRLETRLQAEGQPQRLSRGFPY